MQGRHNEPDVQTCRSIPQPAAGAGSQDPAPGMPGLAGNREQRCQCRAGLIGKENHTSGRGRETSALLERDVTGKGTGVVSQALQPKETSKLDRNIHMG